MLQKLFQGWNGCRSLSCCLSSSVAVLLMCFWMFLGTNCETNINDCQSSPCHRGECIDGENSFTCNCHPGFTGYLCQTQINECESDPCQFGGLCEDLINGYQCRCKSGTTGPNCEININECYSNPCRNGAKCVDGINRWGARCNRHEQVSGLLDGSGLDIMFRSVLNFVNVYRRAAQCRGRSRNDKLRRAQLETIFWCGGHVCHLIYVGTVYCFCVKQGRFILQYA